MRMFDYALAKYEKTNSLSSKQLKIIRFHKAQLCYQKFLFFVQIRQLPRALIR